MSFKSLNLSINIEKSLQENNYSTPTPVQKKVIPLILDKHDVMVKA